MASSPVSIRVAISTNMPGKGLVKLARKGAGVDQPVSPPVARGAVTADVERSRSRCAACSGWLAYGGLYYLCTTQTTQRHSRNPPNPCTGGTANRRTPVPNPTAIHDRRHDGGPVNTPLKLDARVGARTTGDRRWTLSAEPRACDGDFTSILHRRNDRSPQGPI